MLHIIQRARKTKLVLLMLALASQSAYALKDDTEQPLNIISKEQIADFESNKAIFIKDVVATQGSMELHADKAELSRNSNGELQEVKAYGKPATFKQLQDDGKLVHSQSSIIQYLPEKNLLILIGRATIWQDNSHVDGERIEYNTVTRQLKASNENSQGGRVQSTFLPQELKK
ncbi:lipopolysaccharide transport periplasmic protein LptA [uncultured Succinivibrio sp.]|uniref:lipopolysaccharide transport periplasmic protein LptA n=1 Tax=uncultured Succinivibrio sp. TaxID=540749 RepID=UPI0025F5DC86|nr:lipopolysaccharide transport periplasmic protein LptA [uncultured Succinivibrio sp.]